MYAALVTSFASLLLTVTAPDAVPPTHVCGEPVPMSQVNVNESGTILTLSPFCKLFPGIVLTIKFGSVIVTPSVVIPTCTPGGPVKHANTGTIK